MYICKLHTCWLQKIPAENTFLPKKWQGAMNTKQHAMCHAA